jgi:5-methylcytosine-specific restriction endonuclease McrA
VDTLVLNRNFYAIQITDWKRAFSLLYADNASVVDEEYRLYDFETWRELSAGLDEHPQGFIRTPTFRIAIPDVIQLRSYDRLPPMQVKFTRRNIYEHYGFRCCYCGEEYATESLNLEHIIPRSRGGRSDWNNVVTACIACNTHKANRLPDEAGMRLLIQPTKPRWKGPVSLLFRPGVEIRASWQKFIDTFYWDGELRS